MTGEYAALALLRIRDMYGYEMSHYFEGDELGEVCPIEQSMLYSYLRNVEQRGLVAWQEERAGQRPPRKRFSLTADGTLAVDRWLRQPVGRLREVRLDLLLKLYVLHQVNPRAERRLVQEQVEVCEAYRTKLQARFDGADDQFEQLVAGSKLSAAVATLDWLRGYAESLGRNRVAAATA